MAVEKKSGAAAVEYKTTSFRLPVRVMEHMQDICNRKDWSQNEFLHNAVMNYIDEMYLEMNGGKVFRVENPQDQAEATKETALKTCEKIYEIKKINVDEHLKCCSGINQFIDFLYERLVKGNAENGRFYY